MSNAYKDQLRILEDELKKVPENRANKGLWRSLFHVLTYFGGAMERMEELISGNGKDGLIDRVDKVENRLNTMESRVKVIQSDVRETLNMARKQLADKPAETSKLKEVGWATLQIVIAAILVWLLTDIFPRIFSFTT